MGEDPVKEGLVANLNRPGGNITGFSYFANLLFGKKLGLLHECVPKDAAFGLLVNPENPNAEPDTKDAQIAADALGRRLHVFKAKTEREFGPAFEDMGRLRVGGLCVNIDLLFFDRREQIIAIAERRSIPAIYDRRDFPVEGGLMSYGASQADSWRQGGIYVGRILKGEKPADLPVQQSTKFDECRYWHIASFRGNAVFRSFSEGEHRATVTNTTRIRTPTSNPGSHDLILSFSHSITP
jgi:putative ABC transport system substrate-binding protein